MVTISVLAMIFFCKLLAKAKQNRNITEAILMFSSSISPLHKSLAACPQRVQSVQDAIAKQLLLSNWKKRDKYSDEA